MIPTKDSPEPSNSNGNGRSVAAVAGSGSTNGSPAADDRGYNFPNSRRVYVNGELHPDIRVPFREISQAPTKSFTGELEPNEPIRVYDCSGPWGYPAQSPDSAQGLAPIRAEW